MSRDGLYPYFHKICIVYGPVPMSLSKRITTNSRLKQWHFVKTLEPMGIRFEVACWLNLANSGIS